MMHAPNAKGPRRCTRLLGSSARGLAGCSHSAHCSAILLCPRGMPACRRKGNEGDDDLAIGRWNIQVRPPHDRCPQQCTAAGLQSARLLLRGTDPTTRVLASEAPPDGTRQSYPAYRHQLGIPLVADRRRRCSNNSNGVFPEKARRRALCAGHRTPPCRLGPSRVYPVPSETEIAVWHE